MKWYPVDKFTPVDPTEYIVYQKETGCVFIASCTTLTGGGYEFDLDDETGSLKGITHFAFIEPIEKEE